MTGSASSRGEGPMTTVAVVPERTEAGDLTYRVMVGERQAVGKTIGEALDGLTGLFDEDGAGTLILVQNWRPDRFFNAAQQERLGELMARWRAARDAGEALP